MHVTWYEVIELVKILPGCIYDKASRRTLDPGQAICRQAYGLDWENHPAMEADGEKPVPEELLSAAREMVKKEPEWAMYWTIKP